MAPDTRPKSVAKANAVVFGTEHTAHKTDDSADWGFSLPKIHGRDHNTKIPSDADGRCWCWDVNVMCWLAESAEGGCLTVQEAQQGCSAKGCAGAVVHGAAALRDASAAHAPAGTPAERCFRSPRTGTALGSRPGAQ